MKVRNLCPTLDSNSILCLMLHLIILSLITEQVCSKLQMVPESKLDEYIQIDQTGELINPKFFFKPEKFLLQYNDPDNNENGITPLKENEICRLSLLYIGNQSKFMMRNENPTKDNNLTSKSFKKGDKFFWTKSIYGLAYTLFSGHNAKACKALLESKTLELKYIIDEVKAIRSEAVSGVEEVNKIEDLTIDFYTLEEPEISISEIMKLGNGANNHQVISMYPIKSSIENSPKYALLQDAWNEFIEKLNVESLSLVNIVIEFCDSSTNDEDEGKLLLIYNLHK